MREQPSREATEYQGCPVALQGDRENREAAQERFKRCCHLCISGLCVPKTLSVLMERWNHLSWRNDRAALFRSGRPDLAIQVEVAA
jgi:hypothetical protein